MGDTPRGGGKKGVTRSLLRPKRATSGGDTLPGILAAPGTTPTTPTQILSQNIFRLRTPQNTQKLFPTTKILSRGRHMCGVNSEKQTFLGTYWGPKKDLAHLGGALYKSSPVGALGDKKRPTEGTPPVGDNKRRPRETEVTKEAHRHQEKNLFGGRTHIVESQRKTGGQHPGELPRVSQRGRNKKGGGNTPNTHIYIPGRKISRGETHEIKSEQSPHTDNTTNVWGAQQHRSCGGFSSGGPQKPPNRAAAPNHKRPKNHKYLAPQGCPRDTAGGGRTTPTHVGGAPTTFGGDNNTRVGVPPPKVVRQTPGETPFMVVTFFYERKETRSVSEKPTSQNTQWRHPTTPKF